jgi:hypothetical protein
MPIDVPACWNPPNLLWRSGCIENSLTVVRRNLPIFFAVNDEDGARADPPDYVDGAYSLQVYACTHLGKSDGDRCERESWQSDEVLKTAAYHAGRIAETTIGHYRPNAAIIGGCKNRGGSA